MGALVTPAFGSAPKIYTEVRHYLHFILKLRSVSQSGIKLKPAVHSLAQLQVERETQLGHGATLGIKGATNGSTFDICVPGTALPAGALHRRLGSPRGGKPFKFDPNWTATQTS